MRVETLSRGWDSTRGTVFELSDEQVEQLTEVAEMWGREPMRSRTPGAEIEVDGEAGEANGAAEAWEQPANDAQHTETRETVVEAVREGGEPPGRRPERQCRQRVQRYGP